MLRTVLGGPFTQNRFRAFQALFTWRTVRSCEPFIVGLESGEAEIRPLRSGVGRTVRYHPSGRSATGGQSGQEQADGPGLFFCVADRTWRTVYSEPFPSDSGTFYLPDGPQV